MTNNFHTETLYPTSPSLTLLNCVACLLTHLPSSVSTRYTSPYSLFITLPDSKKFASILHYLFIFRNKTLSLILNIFNHLPFFANSRLYFSLCSITFLRFSFFIASFGVHPIPL
ncbi:hypothetical protein EDEG_01601 [Edhazardia aedis USNM 41457]|uniref:Uncharacterized protein n=1 Tax=Edhazardia aedis (strain USNM 41457) TaxID=1003232 RepID=J9D8P7_EDHAE|nr:hypothetical protein EDEG_01601 [Edhazardia aedis USNM 41457]|eukprot:EJW04121.1 hypothetical protein EDEG_01601 [Edhazardia aedis USNM 41457]